MATTRQEGFIAKYGFTLSLILLIVSTPYLILLSLKFLYWNPGSNGKIIYHHSGTTLFNNEGIDLGYIVREICHSSEIVQFLFYSSPTPDFFNFFSVSNLYCFAVACAFALGIVLYKYTKSLKSSLCDNSNLKNKFTRE